MARMITLAAYCVATAVLIGMESLPVGGVLLLLCLALVLRDKDAAYKRKLGVLLGCSLILGLTNINTDLANRNFTMVGTAFFLVIAFPAAVLGRTDPATIRYRLFPRKFRWLDIFYVAISFPLAYAIIKFYFGYNDYMPTQWYLPPVEDSEQIWRLFVGINCVGIWDELFFVNTVFAVLRSTYSLPVANAAQAVVYTSVLYNMAFTGLGVFIVYIFALTQGSMFEESESLIYVILVHLIVDAFLFTAIVAHYYPDTAHPLFLLKSVLG